MFCIKYDGGFDNVVTGNHLPGNINRLLELNLGIATSEVIFKSTHHQGTTVSRENQTQSLSTASQGGRKTK